MTSTETTIGAVSAAVILVLQWWYKAQADKREEARKAAEELRRSEAEARKKEAEDRKESDRVTHEKIGDVLRVVNGPSGIVMASLATALERIARTSLTDVDILAANAARTASNQHNTDAAKSEASRVLAEAAERQIIEEFKASQ